MATGEKNTRVQRGLPVHTGVRAGADGPVDWMRDRFCELRYPPGPQRRACQAGRDSAASEG